jgi:hypothetical protein
MLMAETVVGRDGNMRPKLLIPDILEIASEYGRWNNMSI